MESLFFFENRDLFFMTVFLKKIIWGNKEWCFLIESRFTFEGNHFWKYRLVVFMAILYFFQEVCLIEISFLKEIKLGKKTFIFDGKLSLFRRKLKTFNR